MKLISNLDNKFATEKGYEHNDCYIICRSIVFICWVILRLNLINCKCGRGEFLYLDWWDTYRQWLLKMIRTIRKTMQSTCCRIFFICALSIHAIFCMERRLNTRLREDYVSSFKFNLNIISYVSSWSMDLLKNKGFFSRVKVQLRKILPIV